MKKFYNTAPRPGAVSVPPVTSYQERFEEYHPAVGVFLPSYSHPSAVSTGGVQPAFAPIRAGVGVPNPVSTACALTLCLLVNGSGSNLRAADYTTAMTPPTAPRGRLVSDSAEPMSVSGKLGLVREVTGLSTSALAAILGVSRPTIYNWLKGEALPQPDHRELLDLLAGWAARWRARFPSYGMDHWLTDSAPGEPSLLELLRHPTANQEAVGELLGVRITQCAAAEERAAAAREAAEMVAVRTIRQTVSESVARWDVARENLRRAANLRQ